MFVKNKDHIEVQENERNYILKYGEASFKNLIDNAISFTDYNNEDVLEIDGLAGLLKLELKQIFRVKNLYVNGSRGINTDSTGLQEIIINNCVFNSVVLEEMPYLNKFDIDTNSITSISFTSVNPISYLNENNQMIDSLTKLTDLSIQSFNGSILNLENLSDLKNLTITGYNKLSNFDKICLADKSYEKIQIENIEHNFSDSDSVVSLFDGILTRNTNTVIEQLIISNSSIQILLA